MYHWNPDPVAFQIGPLSVSWYGLSWSFTILVGYLYCLYVFNREKRDAEYIVPLIQYVFVGALVGARLFDVFYYNFDYFISDPLMVFRIWEGGLASHGGLMGVVLAIYIFSKRNKQFSFWWVLDTAAIIGMLQGGIIRIGNFINGELYGKVTDVPWAVVFEGTDRFMLPRHPVQLYEAFYYFLCFIVLFTAYHLLKKRKEGFYISIYLIMAFAGRILIEFTKDATPVAGVFSQTQIVSIVGLFVGVVVFYNRVLKKPSTVPENVEK
jgi:phosphatidylglycerol---prolipoprotein diacylglyceryl transferase